MHKVELSTSTFFVGLLLYVVREIWFDLYNLLENILSFRSLTNFGNSRLSLQHRYNIVVIFFSSSFVTSDTLVKKLSVSDSISFRTTNSPSGNEYSLLSSFPKQGNPFIIYLLLTSHANQKQLLINSNVCTRFIIILWILNKL